MSADRQQASSAPDRPARLGERSGGSRAGLAVVAGGRGRGVRAPRTGATAGAWQLAPGASVARAPGIVRPLGTPGMSPLEGPPRAAGGSGPRAGIARRFGGLAARHRSLVPLPFVLAIALVSEAPGALAAGAGALLVLAGLALRLAASAAVVPDRRLATSGVHAWLRRPHDLGTILAWAGIALAAGASTALPALVLGLALLHLFAARSEERALAARHGDRFARWRRRTPAWIPRRPVASLARAADGAAALRAERGALAGFAALLLVASLGALAR